MKLYLLVILVGCALASPIIQPRPVDNTRDPHDGEPFEWEPVDDDPWPGPSFTFPQLPGVDDVDVLSRPASLPEAEVRAALLMQLLRAIFNNGNNNYNNNNKNRNSDNTISYNEVNAAPSKQQRLGKPGVQRGRSR